MKMTNEIGNTTTSSAPIGHYHNLMGKSETVVESKLKKSRHSQFSGAQSSDLHHHQHQHGQNGNASSLIDDHLKTISISSATKKRINDEVKQHQQYPQLVQQQRQPGVQSLSNTPLKQIYSNGNAGGENGNNSGNQDHLLLRSAPAMKSSGLKPPERIVKVDEIPEFRRANALLEQRLTNYHPVSMRSIDHLNMMRAQTANSIASRIQKREDDYSEQPNIKLNPFKYAKNPHNDHKAFYDSPHEARVNDYSKQIRGNYPKHSSHFQENNNLMKKASGIAVNYQAKLVKQQKRSQSSMNSHNAILIAGKKSLEAEDRRGDIINENAEGAVAAPVKKSAVENINLIMSREHFSMESMKISLGQLSRIVVHDLLTGGPDSTGVAELRGILWKIFIGVQEISLPEYEHLLNKGFHPDWVQKIDKDVDRTFKHDAEFGSRVGTSMLTRILHAFIWQSEEIDSSQELLQRSKSSNQDQLLLDGLHHSHDFTFGYVQGMNVMAGPFCLVLNELEAFYSLSTFWRQVCPLYVQPNLEGVHCGLKLVSICLFLLDRELYNIYKLHRFDGNLFSHVMSFCANVRPLNQLIILWDYFMAQGVAFHLNILSIIALLIMMKPELVARSHQRDGWKLLREIQLDSRAVIKVIEKLKGKLPVTALELMKRHLYDPNVSKLVTEYECNLIHQDEA